MIRSATRATILIAFLAALLATWPGSVRAASKNSRPVTLQLKWRHQFQFAGFYAAKANGYYEEVGLNVTFKERTQGMDVAQEVTEGRAEFGVGDSELLLDYADGNPVMVVGAIFQHAPQVILSRADSGITGPRDLRGRRVMLAGTTSPTLWAMLYSQGIGKEDITVQSLSWTIDDLMAGRTDAMAAYLTDQPYDLKRHGIPANIMRPLTYGIDFYGDLLFTSRSLAKKDPHLVEDFARASFKGWKYAMAHPEEIVDQIILHYHPGKSRPQLLFEAEAMRELILPQLVEIGTMSSSRWQKIANVYTTLDMLQNTPQLNEFVYTPVKQRRLELLAGWAPLLSIVGAGVVFAAIVLFLFNRRLHRGIAQRTEELDRNRKSLRQVLDLVPNMIYAKNRQGQFLMLNKTMAVSLNASIDDLIGKRHENAHSNMRESTLMREAEEEVFKSGVPKVSLAEPYHYKDGSLHWLQTTRLPYIAESTGEEAVLVLSVDITNRRESEAALKDSEERFRAVFNQTFQLIGILSTEGHLLYVNDAALDIYGADRKDVLNQPFQNTVWWEKDEATQMWLKDCIRRASDGEVIRSETWHELPDGRKLNIDFSIKPVRNGEGEIIYLISEGRDITNLKQAQRKLRRLNDELEMRVKERTKNLAEAKEELLSSLEELEKTQAELIMSEKLAALGGLVAGVAHEINTPLGVGVTASSYLEEKLKELSDKYEQGTMKKSDLDRFIANGQESCRNILTNLHRAAELIKSFKQVAADQSSELPRAFNLKEYVDEILLSLRPKFKRTPHVVENHCPDVSMHSYPGAFMQIVTNLLMNALLHAFDDETPGHIDFGGSVEGDTLTFTMSDDGRGIEPELLDKIFEPFYTTKRNWGGTGLGLHIVYNTVTQTLDGTINVDSTPGKGTRYEMTLPLAKKNER